MRALLPLIVLSSLAAPTLLADDGELGPRVAARSDSLAPDLGAGLRLQGGRALYRGPSSLANRYPYLVAATAAELAERRGIELRWENLHRLLEAIPSEAAARSLVRTMVGGEIVPDRAAYDRLVDAARKQIVPEGAWEISVDARAPERFGLAAERTADGFAVHGTIFTTSGYSALCVVEIEARFPAAGPFTLEEHIAITGPPQSWQTSGEVDEEWQRKAHRYVLGVRAALLAELRREWTLETVAAAYTEGATFAVIRRKLGEPIHDLGEPRKEHRYVYRLGDGRAVVFAVRGEDEPIESATLHAGYDLDAGLGERLEELAKRPVRAGKMRKD